MNRILVVEDEESISKLLKLNLELEGYEVLVADDGKSALDLIRNQHFDLYLLDVMLPEIDGFDICQQIRLTDTETPVMFLTAKDAAFDLIITDLVLPNISGVAIISIVKKKFPDTPVIAITGWGEHPESLAKEAHADYVLEKPFKLPELEQLAKKLLNG